MKTVIFTDKVLKKQYQKNPQDFVGVFNAISKSDLSVIFMAQDVHSCCLKMKRTGIQKLKKFSVISWQPTPEKKKFSSEDVIDAYQLVKSRHHETVVISDDQSDFAAVNAAGASFILVSDNESSTGQKKYPVKRFYGLLKELSLI